MEELENVTRNTSVVKISSCLYKIYKKICEDKENKIVEHNIKEIDFLKAQCKTENIQLCLMSCQTFIKLAENGVLELGNVMSMLISLLPNSNFNQYTAITEGVISLLLLSLKRKTAQTNSNEKFQCQFGLKAPQHPLITLILKDGSNMNDIANKISGICNHHDKEIKQNSIEFLRPVYLYILCNPQMLPDSKAIWTALLAQSTTSKEADELVKEIVSWSKLTNPNSCLFTSILVIEAIQHNLNKKNHQHAIELLIYLAHIVNELINFGIDPRPALHSIYETIHKSSGNDNKNYYNVLLVLLAQTLHIICPIYLPDLLRIFEFIIIKENSGNQYILLMILDGIIQWMSQPAFIPIDGITMSTEIVKKILQNPTESIQNISTINFRTNIKILHSTIGIAFDIAKLAESFESAEDKNVFTFVDALNTSSRLKFCSRINLFLRAIFLSKDPSLDCWFKIYQVILSIVKSSEDISVDFIMTFLFKLSKETNPEIQLELLRGLSNFAVSKDNVPIILSTIQALFKIHENDTICMDLYLRLWKVENRTFPFLHKILSKSPHEKSKSWEFHLTKAYTIKEICSNKPSQYGTELVSHLSDTLNICTDEKGDLATSLALDAIIILCESNTVNITSTWKAISGKFRHEKRFKALKSLYNFFSYVPLLKMSSLEYTQFFDEAIEHLWLVIVESDKPELVKSALMALKHYEMELRHIPLKYRQGIITSRYPNDPDSLEMLDYVPGEVWIQLLEKIRPDCLREASDLIGHFIYKEIESFRGGIYRLPEGVPEPRKFGSSYFPKSTLKAIINYLVPRSRLEHFPEPDVITKALSAISKKFPKPIPPLNWCFLHSFFNLNSEARKYCLLIATNQISHSGSAQRLLENFLVDFKPNCFEEDLLLLFSLLPDFAKTIETSILKAFIEKIAIYCFKESQLNGFIEGCLFEKFLISVKYVFTSDCEVQESLDVFTLIVERYMDAMDLDSRLFEKYTEVVGTLHPNSIDGLTSPSTWWEVPIGKLKKATIIRCYLVLYNTKLENPLNWLGPLIDAYAENKDAQEFFFRHLAITLYAFNDDKNSCAWTMDLFRQIQTLLADSTNTKKQEKVFFLLDVFVLCVTVFSGSAILLGNLDIAATLRNSRMDIFPESLQILCDHIFWKDNEAKIYEIIHHLYKNPIIPDHYSEMFKNSIICSRNRPYFENKTIWTKYVGMRK